MIKRTDRWYWRCCDCLRVVAVNERLPKAECAICDGAMECMGQVVGCTLATVQSTCACDHRCTHAKGPNCDCKCGGENHGTGATVEVLRNVTGIPRLGGTGTRATAEEYRAGVAALEAEIERYRTLGRWLSDLEYRRRYYVERKLAKVRTLKTHKGRMELLRAAVVTVG